MPIRLQPEQFAKKKKTTYSQKPGKFEFFLPLSGSEHKLYVAPRCASPGLPRQ